MNTFKFSVSGTVEVHDTEYTFYEHKNDRFKNFKNYSNISVAMAKINNLILGNPDFSLDDIRVSGVDTKTAKDLLNHIENNPDFPDYELADNIEKVIKEEKN